DLVNLQCIHCSFLDSTGYSEYNCNVFIAKLQGLRPCGQFCFSTREALESSSWIVSMVLLSRELTYWMRFKAAGDILESCAWLKSQRSIDRLKVLERTMATSRDGSCCPRSILV